MKAYAATRHVLVITGMRRTGKTTLLKRMLSEVRSENKAYFDLENVSDRDFFDRKNYDAILFDLEQRGLDTKKKLYLAIDEIQFLPNITSVIKYLYDHYTIKFFVTGSSSYYLKNLFTQSLAGRKIVFELFPLDFGEFLTFKNIAHKENRIFSHIFSRAEYDRLHPYYEEFIEFGGFPEVMLTKNRDIKKELLRDIISSYINIDIQSLSDFRKGADVYNLVKILASRTATRLDYSKLAKLSGLARPTVESYIDFFEKTYLITRIPVFTRNTDREIVKARKIFFCDNGLMNILAENSSGVKFENALFNQLRQRGDIRYYALKNGSEIDFIFNSKMCIEAKESPIRTDLGVLTRLSRIAKLKEMHLIGRHEVSRFDKYVWGGSIH
ncbi:ATP-binding protein [Candidatus Uhrbacteria bacterium]|nr:ATP-binding protein [Candidatus Uhrbacteria bacterium]